MTNKTFKVRRGERVTLRVGAASTKTTPEPEDAPGGIALSDEEDDLYVRRGQIQMEFFDLGTRLRSTPPDTDFTDPTRYRPRNATDAALPDDEAGNVSEYLEVENELVPETTIIPQWDAGLSPAWSSTLRAAQIADYDAGLFGRAGDLLDPFGFTRVNGSERQVPNCMPLPYDIEQGLLNVYLGRKRYRVGFGQPDVYPVDVETERAWRKLKYDHTADVGERWSLVTLATGHVGAEVGELKTKTGGGLAVIAQAHYDSFDTSDKVGFKVTAEPHYEAEEIEFKVTPHLHRIYLRPRLQLWSNDWQIRHLFDNPNDSNPPFYFFQNFTRYAPFLLASRSPLYRLVPFPLRYDDNSVLKPISAGWMRQTFHALAQRSALGEAEYQRLKENYAAMLNFEFALAGQGDFISVAEPLTQQSAVFSDTDYSQHPSSDRPDGTIYQPLFEPQGMLVGVIARGTGAAERRFYVWLRSSLDTAWRESAHGFPYSTRFSLPYTTPIPEWETLS